MVLPDTDVVSELRKGHRADAGVQAYFAALGEQDVYLAVHTVGELRRGVELIRRRGDAEQARRLEQWPDRLVESHAARILAFDPDCAQVWGRLTSPDPAHPVDKQIAAIALIHDLTVATRDTADFASTGVRLLNPFS